MSSSKKYNVAVIGYGLSAKIFQIPFITAVPEHFKFYAVVQRTPTAENNAEKDWPGIKSYRSAEELVKDPNVDIVVVGTSPSSHYALTKLCLENGKHVIVEKPFVPTAAEADSLIALAASKSLLLTVFQNRRFDADFQTVQKILPTLGRISEFETHFDRHRPVVPAGDSWKYTTGAGHGVIYDLGTHLMDQVVVLFGMPSRITGIIATQRENNTAGFEDSATILLHYDDYKGTGVPLLATAKFSVVSPETQQLRYWVRGTQGSFKKYHLDVQEDQLKAGLRPGDAGYGLEPKERYGVLNRWNEAKGVAEPETVPTVEGGSYADFYRRVARALGGEKGAIPVKPETARDVIRLVELARESSRLGKTLDV